MYISYSFDLLIKKVVNKKKSSGLALEFILVEILIAILYELSICYDSYDITSYILFAVRYVMMMMMMPFSYVCCFPKGFFFCFEESVGTR